MGPVETPRGDLNGVHVLVIDDDRETRDLLRSALEYCGALVTSVDSAEDALKIIDRVLPSAVLCDIAMPQHDGYWFLRELRARHGAARVPVVAVTAHVTQHGPDRTFPAGFQAYVGKPVDPWEMSRVIAGLVHRP